MKSQEKTQDYIWSVQGMLFGQPEIEGFGDRLFYVREIERNEANAVIVKNHYSGKFYSASYIHLGLYVENQLRGVLQFGYAMNPQN